MKRYSIILLLLGFSYLVNAQQPIVLTLDKAVELALQNNLSIVQTQNNVDVANSGLLAAYGSYLPTVSAFGGWDRSHNITAAGVRRIQGIPVPVPASRSTSNSFQTGVSLGYTIFNGYRREANFKKASAEAATSEQTAIRTKQLIRYQIEATYLNVLQQDQLVKVADENLKRDQRQLERITESNRIGALSLADVYRQQSQVAADEYNVINTQNTYNKAKADLVALIGLDMTKEYQFSDPAISVVIEQTELDASKEMYKNESELVRRALNSRPDYLATKENLEASKSSITAAWGGYFPSISASAGYSLSNPEFKNLNDNRSISWGISLNWNIFDGFLTNQGVQTAIIAKKNNEETLKQTERDISVQVRKALLDLESGMKQIEVSQKGLQSATEDRKIAEERYNLGAGTLLDLLTANSAFVQAQANQIGASFFYVTAKRNLENVLGERKE